MKRLLTYIFLLCSLFAQAQNWTAALPHNATISGSPSNNGSWFRLNTTTGRVYQWNPNTVSWNAVAQGIDVIVGSIPPAYTPAYQQSTFAVNAVDSLYYYRSGAWHHLNPGGGGGGATYTAGTGISISGGNVISNTGDLSNTNEIQRVDTLSLSGNTLSVSILNDAVPAITVDLSGIVGTGTDLSINDLGGSDVMLQSSTGSGVEIQGTNGITVSDIGGGILGIDGYTAGTGIGISGNVISNTSPSLWTDAGAYSYLTSITDNVGIGLSSAPTARLHVRGAGATSATLALRLDKSTGAGYFYARNDGRIGILNSAPAFPLDVTGDVHIDQQSAYRIGNSKIAYTPASGYWFFGDAGNVTCSGDRGIGIGARALLNLTTGPLNVAIGDDALKQCTTCAQNFAIGTGTLQRCTTGVANVGVGLYVLNTGNGSNNTALGDQGQTISTGSRNTSIGALAVYFNTTANDNTGIGYLSLANNTTGGDNTSIGRSCLEGLNGGIRNIAIGNYAADNLTTGGRNICIGWNVDMPTPTTSESLNIGNLIFGDGINASGTTISGGSVGIGVNSPQRRLDVNGDVRVRDLTTDNPTVLVGADGDGDLSKVKLGTRLTLSNDTINVTLLTAGAYTPTLTGVTNVTSTTAKNCQYSRNGNTVTVFGSCDVTTTAFGATVVGVSLPIASNIANANDCNGPASQTDDFAKNGYVEGDATNDRASLKFTGLGSGTMFFSFSYTVL